MSIFTRLINHEKKELRKFSIIADQIEALSPKMEKLSDEKLRAKTETFKKKLAKGADLDDIIVEAFAVAREAAWRVIGEKPFYVQLIGGLTIHYGNIAEMKTGEGKTLVAVMPAYLNALTGEGVHIVTVNEYLVNHAAEWMGPIFEFLGLTVGTNLKDHSVEEKREQYLKDVLYSTDNEIGFDFLRDNMVVRKEDRVMRGLNFAIVDEVDSVLVDEARTPLIISGGVVNSANLYLNADRFVKTLKAEDDYSIDEQSKTISLTDQGVSKAEKHFGMPSLYEVNNTALVHHIINALRANYIFAKDVDYVVQPEHGIVIVDKFTGRLMHGRAFSEGIHQAIEAKEGVKIQAETRTIAKITFQSLFRMYKKLSGMTGTAKTEEEEFREIFNMYVIPIPTNVPVIREDFEDIIFLNKKGKYKAIIKEIEKRHATGQPVLVGTASVEVSELVSKMLKDKKIKHEVLNAKNHAREALIIREAGKKGAITIATNMAGRGTDIKLTDEVRELGGLAVIGTERHESRRIDNQLRGRAGRQGDPGFSQFCISLEDELLIRFGSDRLKFLTDKLNHDEDLAIRIKMFSRSVESSQKRVEGNNFDSRKNLLQFDEVIGKQRDVIYARRNLILETDDMHKEAIETIKNHIYAVVMDFAGDNEKLEIGEAEDLIINISNELVRLTMKASTLVGKNIDDVIEKITNTIVKQYEDKMKVIPKEQIAAFESNISLSVIDSLWTDHINTMEQLEESMQLQRVAAINPVQAYMIEGAKLFDELLDKIDKEITLFLLRAEVRSNLEKKQTNKPVSTNKNDETAKQQPKKNKQKIGRNEPCPCKSGKKYKQCCAK